MSARPFAALLSDGRLAIHAVKATYVLTAGEVLALLPCCKSLWIVAARRGKAWKRGVAAERRTGNGATTVPGSAVKSTEAGCASK